MSAKIETRVTVAGREITTGEAARQAAMDLERLGSGVSRTAYSLGGASVLKLAHNEYGKKSNLQERDTWLMIQADAEYIASFAPVQACAEDGSWLVMAHVEGVGDGDYPDAELSDALTHYGIQDMHGANFGFGDTGQCVAVDYAMTSKLLAGVIRGDHERDRYSELGSDCYAEQRCDWCGAHYENCECCGECEGSCQACHECGNHGADRCPACDECECEHPGGLCDDCYQCVDCCACECEVCGRIVSFCDDDAECGGAAQRDAQRRLLRAQAMLRDVAMYDRWGDDDHIARAHGSNPWFVREAGAKRADALMVLFPGIHNNRWEAGAAAVRAWADRAVVNAERARMLVLG